MAALDDVARPAVAAASAGAAISPFESAAPSGSPSSPVGTVFTGGGTAVLAVAII
ncbi:MAG: hypothetical protein IPK07_34965 [Deltaproteobacteria bacterium]|nr:hypothetical protein [Deltaproteobacteria bacterium]